MAVESKALDVLDAWYASLDLYRDKLPSRGSIAGALHTLARLRDRYDLRISSHVSGGQSQIIGLSGAAVRRILAKFGETRELSAIGGRSNRGVRGAVAKLLNAMRSLKLEELNESDRDRVLIALQRRLVMVYVNAYFAVKRIKASFDANSSTYCFIHAIIENARMSGKAGPIAEHLIGAKLALRFPDKEIRNKPFSTSDFQGGFSGDFEIGNTAFHVTVAPMPELLAKCKTNLENGLRVYLLVTDAHVVGTRQNVELIAPGRIAVESIESFVATNVDELSEFDGDRLKSGFRRLLEKYNERVATVEVDKSMLIDIPPNLA